MTKSKSYKLVEQTLIDSLSETIDAIEGIDFPGMY